MKVSELIADLQKCEQDAVVFVEKGELKAVDQVPSFTGFGNGLPCVDLIDKVEYEHRVSMHEFYGNK